ncbi:hypothetical protein ABIB82_000356 [Bradyrhizobium sp. i1.8.4]
MVASWLQHLRHHHRVTNTDMAVQKAAHFIAAKFRQDGSDRRSKLP